MWFFLAGMMAICAAGMRLINQHYRVSAFHLTVMNKLVQGIVLMPVAMIVPWPDDPIFYGAVLVTVPLVVYGDTALFRLCGIYGGGPVSRLEPLANILLFIAWTIISPVLLVHYLDDPIRLFFISLAIFGSVFCAIQMRKGEVSFEVFCAMMPLIIVTAIIDFLSKTAMDASSGGNGTVVYMFMQSFLIGTIGLIHMRKTIAESKQVICTLNFGKTLGFLVLANLAYGFCKTQAYILVENPAYVNVIALTASLWILLYNRVVGHPDNIRVLPGMCIVGCAFILILASQL